jgi:hypothetical protein
VSLAGWPRRALLRRCGRRGGEPSSTAAELSVRSTQAAGVRRRPAPDALRLPLAGDDHGGVNRRTGVFAAWSVLPFHEDPPRRRLAHLLDASIRAAGGRPSLGRQAGRANGPRSASTMPFDCGYASSCDVYLRSSSASSVVPSGSSSTVRWPYHWSRSPGLVASVSAVRSVGCSDIICPFVAFAGADHRTRVAGVKNPASASSSVHTGDKVDPGPTPRPAGAPGSATRPCPSTTRPWSTLP